MKFTNHIYLFCATILTLATACTNELPFINVMPDEPHPLVVVADLAGKAKTRAAQGTDDEWSYTDFENGDIMGFFSQSGNWNDGGGFDNIALRYDAALKQFSDVNNGAAFSPTQMSGSKIYMYYPYSPDIQTTGFELRTKGVSSGDTLRCVDFLSSYSIQVAGVLNGVKMALFGEFDHAFSELIIMRGEGFDNPPEDKRRITAVIDNPVTHIKVTIDTQDGSWVATPELVYQENNTYNLSREEAARWDAWHARNYGITVQDKEGRPAWYIIVPTIGSEEGKKRPGARTTVQYIELYDNEGNLQQVTSLRLSGGMTKFVDAGWRYPMEITMKEMVPTVNPYTIVPWNEDVNLTDQRTRGINNIAEFEDWVRQYNAYIIESTEERINALLKYGDLYVDEDKNNLWHFYLLNDLDMSQYSPAGSDNGQNPTETDVIVPVLKDILDGKGTTLVNGKYLNNTIKGLSKTFVGELTTTNGQITNIDFDSPEIRRNTTSPIGIIANTIIEGTVEDCDILNGRLINIDGPAGYVAGTLDSGTVTGCTLDGFLISNSNVSPPYEKILGKDPTGTFTFRNNNAENVITTAN